MQFNFYTDESIDEIIKDCPDNHMVIFRLNNLTKSILEQYKHLIGNYVKVAGDRTYSTNIDLLYSTVNNLNNYLCSPGELSIEEYIEKSIVKYKAGLKALTDDLVKNTKEGSKTRTLSNMKETQILLTAMAN